MLSRHLLLIGAMKAGTTALFSALAKHPQIAPASIKEPNTLVDPAAFRKSRAAYEGLWSETERARSWLMEASTAYSKLPIQPSAAVATRRWPAEFRFLYVVRHPIERIRSQYLHSLSEGWITRPICEEIEPLAVLQSNYRFQLMPYVAMHGREKIHVLTYEEFVAQPEAELRRIYGFLGLEPQGALGPLVRANDSSLYRAKYLLRLLEREGTTLSLGEWGSVGNLPASQAERVLRLHRQEGRAALLLRELEGELERHICPSAAQVESIRTFLAPDLELFRQEWGIDVWRKSERSSQSPAAVA